VSARARETVRELLDVYREHDVLTSASGISFQTFFALIPLALFGLGLLGTAHLQELWQGNLAPDLRSGLSPDAFRVVNDTVNQVLQRRQVLWATLGALLAVWEVSGAVRGVMGSLNRLYETSERRGFMRRYAVSIGLATVVSVLVLSAVTVVLLGPVAAAAVLGHVGTVGVAVFFMRWLVAVALLLVAVALLVRFAPDKARPWRWVSFGAAVSVGGWIAMSLIFGWYVRDVANYGSLFGNLATLIVVLEYLYLSAIAFLTGLAIDSLTRRRAEKEAD
jgi:membrane protein